MSQPWYRPIVEPVVCYYCTIGSHNLCDERREFKFWAECPCRLKEHKNDDHTS